MPRRDAAGVACFQLLVQALHQLILGTSMLVYIRILSRTAKENCSSSAYIDVRTRRIGYSYRAYIDIRFVQRKTVQNRAKMNSPEGFLKQPQCLAPAGQSCRYGERTRDVFPPAPLSFNFLQHLVKRKSVRACLSVAPFYLGLHVPFRIEAVIKRVLFSLMF